MSEDEGNREDRERRGGLSDDERAPNRRGEHDDRRNQREEANALVGIRTLIEESFNQLLVSNRRTLRQLQTQDSSTGTLRNPGNERQIRINNSVLAMV